MASLPPVPPTLDPLRSAATINALVREYNRTDRKAPIVGTDTGSGAAYAIAPVPGIVLYEVGQEFTFQAAHANTTTTPTLAVNGLAAGVIKDLAGAALVVGDITANAWVHVVCTSTVPSFALLSVQPASFLRAPLQTLTTSLGADVALNNTASFFTGPSLSLPAGTWWVAGTVSVLDTAGAANILTKLWDGTTVYDSAQATIGASNFMVAISQQGVVTNTGPSNKTVSISCRDITSTSGSIKWNNSGGQHDSSLAAMRIG